MDGRDHTSPFIGDHYPDELEDHLDDFLTEEFHVECADGSPREVAVLLVHVFELCVRGDFTLAAELSLVPALTPLEQSQRDESDRRWSLQNGVPPGPSRTTDADMSEDTLAAALEGMNTGGGAGAGMVRSALAWKYSSSFCNSIFISFLYRSVRKKWRSQWKRGGSASL